MGWTVFFDFDGTLTTADLVEGLLRHFRPHAASPLIHSIKRGDVSLRVGISLLYDLLPSSGRREYQDWVMESTVLRPGVDALLIALRDRGIPFYLLSGGLDAFIEPTLADRFQAGQVYCNQADWRGPRLHVGWPFPCHPAVCRADCGLCKPTLMKRLTPAGSRSVLVGDGVTDIPGAAGADLVFARDRLATYLSEHRRPFHPYDTFHDIHHQIWSYLEHEQEGVTVS